MPDINLIVRSASETYDLQVEVVEDRPAKLLYEALGIKLGMEPGSFGLVIERLGGPIHPDAPTGDYNLRHADVLEVTDSVPEGGYSSARWELRLQGSDESRLLDLPSIDIGRKAEAPGWEVSGVGISRLHARLDVSDEHLTITDLASSNGTFVNGERISEPMKLQAADQVTIGGKVLEVVERRPFASEPAHLRFDEGLLKFNRPPRVQQPIPLVEFKIEDPPPEPRKRRLPLGMAIVPAVMGVSMFLMTGRAYSLIFAAGSPLMAISTYLSDRKSGRTEYRKLREKYLTKLKETEGNIAAARTQASDWRENRWPDASTVLDRAVHRDPLLWHRRTTDEDFLDVRVGRTDQPSLVTVTPSSVDEGELAARVADAFDGLDEDRDVPLVVPLRDVGTVGIAGSDVVVAEAARWILSQLATHHSPREVAVAIIAPGRADTWSWAKWLPHVHALDPEVASIGVDDNTAARIFESLQRIVARREEAESRVVVGSTSSQLPHVVVVIQPPVQFSASAVASFLDLAPSCGISVLWLAAETAVLPGASTVVIEPEPSIGRVTFATSGQTFQGVDLDQFDAGSTEMLARELAPLRDAATASGGGEIPQTIGLFELLDPAPDHADAVISRWEVASDSLTAVIGAGPGTAVAVDLISDGPHALVGGTTGAGKSELLQSLVGSLAASYPPNRVNFVLIDYKGGAAFKDCVDLPHTVGFVTDLDGRLAERAITSLNAELRWREQVLAAGDHKDLTEMRSRDPAMAPANLILIVDEFAALKTEIPEFVDGIVDIARRGRSLGVHLILATQKPRGIISADIQANTNLRIALRVTDSAESTDIIDRADAAHISRHLPGRAYVKTGVSEVFEVQVAYVGGPAAPEPEAATSAHTFRITPRLLELARNDRGDSGESPTQLSAVVDAAIEAAARMQMPEQRRPWLPVLPEQVSFDMLQGESTTSPDLDIGLLDDPEQQFQGNAVLDLSESGHAVFLGTSGAGKTTALRTVAASLSMSPIEMHCYAIDFGGRGLASLSQFPRCGDVVYDDDFERLRRLLTMLSSTANQRRSMLSAQGAASLQEFGAATGEHIPPIVVLVDRFDRLWTLLDRSDRGVLATELASIIGDGKSVGIHFVVTADRPRALPPTAAALFPRRIALRLANADEYSALGIRGDPTTDETPPGRAFLPNHEMQLAVLADDQDTTGGAQARVIGQIATALAEWPVDPPSMVALLSDEVALSELPHPQPGSSIIPIGVEESAMDPVYIDLAALASFLVVGPPGSGRTTTLRTIALGSKAANDNADLFLFGTRRSALFDLDIWNTTAQGPDDGAELAQRIIESLDSSQDSGLIVVVVDDADDLTEGIISNHLGTIVDKARDANVVVLASLINHRATRAFAPWVREMRHAHSGLLLQPNLDSDGEIFHLRLPGRHGFSPPPGRGYLVQGTELSVIQIAH